jgi:hypothetical protein
MTQPHLIAFQDWSGRAPGLTIRTVRRLMAQGRWPQAIRLSPNGQLLWRADILNAHLDALLAPLEVAP